MLEQLLSFAKNASKQIKNDMPNMKLLIDKPNNAGYYDNEVLFSWEAQWSLKIL